MKGENEKESGSIAKKQKMSEREVKGFTLKLENSRILKRIVETLASIIDETNFVVNEERFTVKAMDPSRICLLELHIAKSNFDVFQCKKKHVIGLHLGDLDKIFKRCTSNDTIELKHDENEQKIKLKMEKLGGGRGRTFSLSCLDLDTEEPPLENLHCIDYQSSWTIDPNFFIEALKDGEIYSDVFTIKSTENIGVTFYTMGQIGELEYSLSIEDFLDIDLSEIQTGSFSNMFLKKIMKLAGITEKLHANLLTDHPLKLSFNLIEGGKLEYYLAPRVVSDDLDEDDDLLDDDLMGESEEEMLTEEEE